MTTAADVDAYIAGFPAEVAERLSAMRATIRAQAPLATERISYGVPTFYLNGNLVHFAGFAGHVRFYPGSAAIAAFTAEHERLGEELHDETPAAGAECGAGHRPDRGRVLGATVARVERRAV
jgi:uncharacterized protein YdhG (YjbR/CyaY superfamily)